MSTSNIIGYFLLSLYFHWLSLPVIHYFHCGMIYHLWLLLSPHFLQWERIMYQYGSLSLLLYTTLPINSIPCFFDKIGCGYYLRAAYISLRSLQTSIRYVQAIQWRLLDASMHSLSVLLSASTSLVFVIKNYRCVCAAYTSHGYCLRVVFIHSELPIMWLLFKGGIWNTVANLLSFKWLFTVYHEPMETK